MLFKMRVNGVLPIVPRVNEFPVFGAVLLYGEAKFVAVRKPIVDCPLSVVAVKLVVARDARRDDAGQLVELRLGGWVIVIVRNRGADLGFTNHCTMVSVSVAVTMSQDIGRQQ